MTIDPEPSLDFTGGGTSHGPEGRGAIHSRLRTYVRVMLGIWAGMLVATPILDAVFMLQSLREWLDLWSTWVHFATTVCLSAAAAYLQRARPALSTLKALDVCVTLGQALALAMFVSHIPPVYRPELGILLGLTQVLVLRAALVPSHPARTTTLGVVGGTAVCAATWYAHHRAPPALAFLGPNAAVAVAIVWSGVSVISSTVISTVIYQLHRRVQRAMRLGQYTLQRKLGEGGMGVVYQARHALLRRPTAIKMLPAERAGEAALARFEREVQVTARLSHPNIVSVYDFGRSPEGVFYYAMEYLDGIDLELLVEQDGPQPAGRVLGIMRQAAAGLAEAHAVQLIHRDVKPANMILTHRATAADVLKILDFGLVRELEPGGLPGSSDVHSIRGTPLYMPPEAILAPSTVDERSDIYALGAVGYFLLTGAPLFEGTTALAIFGMQAHTAPLPPSERVDGVPPKLEAVILRCLAKAATERYPSAEALLEALDACDDVAAWTAKHAAAWWAKRPAASRAPGEPARSGTTMAVDLGDRASALGERAAS